MLNFAKIAGEGEMPLYKPLLPPVSALLSVNVDGAKNATKQTNLMRKLPTQLAFLKYVFYKPAARFAGPAICWQYRVLLER